MAAVVRTNTTNWPQLNLWPKDIRSNKMSSKGCGLALCNAAVSSRPIYALQSLSLLVLGSLFWWQLLAPRAQDRLAPLSGVLYLFTACTACSVLGIILTFSPVRVCAIYMQPVDRLGLLGLVRDGWGVTPEKDAPVHIQPADEPPASAAPPR